MSAKSIEFSVNPRNKLSSAPNHPKNNTRNIIINETHDEIQPNL